MTRIHLDDRTVKFVANFAMDLYGIEIDVNEPRSISAGVNALFRAMEVDSSPSQPIAQLAEIKTDLLRLYSRVAKESNPTIERTAA